MLRKGFSRLTQDVFLLPVEISDNGQPPLSSTQTLTVRVCSCDSRDTILSCNVEPYVLPAGLSTGALIAILACIVILLGTERTNHSPPPPDLPAPTACLRRADPDRSGSHRVSQQR